MKYTNPFDGPEPPAHVREVAIGPGSWGPQPYPGGFAYLRPWYGNVWRRTRCPRGRCQGPERCYHWSNGDRSRPWSMLEGRATWPVAHDTAAQSRLHAAYHRRHH